MQDFVVSNSGVKQGSSFPIPAFNSGVVNVESNITSTIQIEGDYFTPDTIVTIDQSHFVINSTIIVNAHLIELNVTLGDFSLIVDRLVDLTIENEGGDSIFVDAINIYDAGWTDLTLGGDELTIGTDDTFDIQRTDNIFLKRDINGLYLSTTSVGWTNAMLFNFLKFQRGSNTTLEFVFKGTTSMMLGIGSDNMALGVSVCYTQSESVLYTHTNGFQGIYSNDGTQGSVIAVNATSVPGKTGWQYFKIKILNDGGLNSLFQVFLLPTQNKSDWNDESNMVYSVTNTATPNNVNLVPVIYTLNDPASRIAGVRKTTL